MRGSSAFITAALVGAAIGQQPLGLLSDRVDRRIAIAVAGLVVAAASIAGFVVTCPGTLVAVIMCGAVVGGGVLPLYSLALAHLADHTEDDELTAGGTRLILVNGLRAAAGPVVQMVGGEARPRRKVRYGAPSEPASQRDRQARRSRER